MKHLHSDHLLDTVLTQTMDDVLSNLPPWPETEISRKAEDVLASLPKEQNDSLRSYWTESGPYDEIHCACWYRSVGAAHCLRTLGEVPKTNSSRHSSMF